MERRPPLEPKPKARRLRAARTHRSALIAGLPEAQRPVAEELSRGGVPGVRAALDKQNETAMAEGNPAIDPGPLLAMAEELWPRMRAAEWRDRAEAALRDVDELDLRDLRSVVVAADGAARDDESRAMATQLREALGRRVDDEHTKWLVELAELVADNRIVAALRRSSRPPKAGAPLPPELAQTLSAKASEALAPDVTPDRWAVLLDALAYSPVRTTVTPAGVPEQKPKELMDVVTRSAPRLPAIAALFGIEGAATPPSRTRRPPRPPAVGRPAGTPPGAGAVPSPPVSSEPSAAAPPPAEPAATEPAAAPTVADEPASENGSATEDEGAAALQEPAPGPESESGPSASASANEDDDEGKDAGASLDVVDVREGSDVEA